MESPYVTSYYLLMVTLAVSAKVLPTPPLFAPAGGNPLEFLDETYPAKIRGMGYRIVKFHDPNFNRF